MPRRSDQRNPVVVNSANEFTEVGYSTGGTPMPVNIIGGVSVADPVNGTVNVKSGTLQQIGTVYSDQLAVITSAGAWGSVGYTAGAGTPLPVNVVAGGAGGGLTQTQERDSAGNWADVGYVAGGGTPLAVNMVATSVSIGDPVNGTVNIIMGTLNTVTQVGTLGTLYYVSGLGMGTVRVESGTVGVSAGTLQTVTQIGTLPTLGTLGTLYYVTGLGMGTVRVESGTVGVSAGTLQTVTQIGTLPTLGTLGTLYYLTTVKELGTVDGVKGGTIDYLNTITQVGTVTRLGTLGTLSYVSNLGTLYRLELGTVQVTMGTLQSVGSATVFNKHDLHEYHSISTVSTTIGSIAQTANKIIKVHYYHIQTDGTWGWSWVDNKNGGGTIDYGMLFNCREGLATPFAQYPGFIIKTSTAGSALLLGSWPAFPCVGTIRATVVYTDDDTS